MPTDPRQAVVICTRGRPADLRRALESVAASARPRPQVLVVDASEAADARQNRAHLGDLFPEGDARHLAYEGTPSLTRQRNAGIDALAPGVEIVHFIDDDAEVQRGYFARLAAALRQDASLGGVGGAIYEPRRTQPAPGGWRERARRFFLLSGKTPGRVLPSGIAVPAQQRAHGGDCTASGEDARPQRVEWLSGCSSSYRRAVFAEARFDPALTGYALHEDLDFSYRVGRSPRWALAVVAGARLVHHVSPSNRYDAARFSRAKVVHRHWFVEKNRPGARCRAAFWWSVAGRAAALRASSSPHREAAWRGLREGVEAVLQRDHPLLRGADGGATASAA